MLRKPHIIILSVLAAASLVFVTGVQSGQQAGIQSKESHAERLWLMSGHARSGDEAFIHWDEDGAVSSRCAKCHSTFGFQDFIADGSVDNDAALGSTIECGVCHLGNEGGAVRNHTAVTFPNGTTVENLGPEAMCMECHQGRESGKSVESRIAGADVPDDDTPSSALGFINIHYYAAAASQLGSVVNPGYEYAGSTYDARFAHVTGYNACITCHNPHSLHVDLHFCNTCHAVSDTRDIRFFGSFMDYDGDGNMKEGMYYEIEGVKTELYSAIRRYAKYVLGIPIVYDAHSYPYFFSDDNDNNHVDSGEGRYSTFSARLLKACYNYQTAQKDPGAYAHGGKYIIEVMYDSIADLNSALPNPSDISHLHRGDEGHFDGSSEAWRHWDEDGEVSSSCAKCHSATGLAYFLENGESQAEPIANGMLCTTCHSSPPAVRRAGPVEFPSGLYADLGDSSNLCLNCHQGRAAKSDVDGKIAGGEGPYSFTNIHYFPSAAIFFGTEVKGGYEYWGKAYNARRIYPNHMGQFDTCVECHMGTESKSQEDIAETDWNHNVHTPNPADCVGCHGQDPGQPHPGADPTMFEFSGIRPATTPDYDGDGNRMESAKAEINGLEAALYTQMQAYGKKIGMPIGYNAHRYPYFFVDTNGNGVIDADESDRYTFDAKMLKAAYNYQMSLKEPNGFVHNSLYVAQLLVDSIQDLGGDVSAYTWR